MLSVQLVLIGDLAAYTRHLASARRTWSTCLEVWALAVSRRTPASPPRAGPPPAGATAPAGAGVLAPHSTVESLSTGFDRGPISYFCLSIVKARWRSTPLRFRAVLTPPRYTTHYQSTPRSCQLAGKLRRGVPYGAGAGAEGAAPQGERPHGGAERVAPALRRLVPGAYTRPLP